VIGTRAGGVLSALLAASVVLAGCSGTATQQTGPTVPAASDLRPATADSCLLQPRPAEILGLPLTESSTERIGPDVIGERLAWAARGKRVEAWVGVNALDALEDLDFAPLQTGVPGVRQWQTVAFQDIYVTERSTGYASPCDRLYISTRGLPGSASVDVVMALKVAYGTG
jgi:hypothetical protein